MHCGQECKMVQVLWKTKWCSSKILNELPDGPAVLLVGNLLKSRVPQRPAHHAHSDALSDSQKWKQPQCGYGRMDEWVILLNRTWSRETMK
jgi:hypothetical protein